MREIKAIIRPHRLDAVLEALHTHPELPGVTVSLVRGFGRTVGRPTSAGAAQIQYGTKEMVKLECVVNDDQVDSVVDVIMSASRTGKVGDGKVFVHPVAAAYKVRTGQTLGRIE
ncbi:MAG: P-II family nitrogen regulator [Planctomycetota bacterium]|nr:MAG: P-II family nitrogen regulator [Planctomycetota bacterium]